MKAQKILLLLVILILCSGFINAQVETDTSKSIKLYQRPTADLRFEVKVKEIMPIGFAYCFEANVVRVNKGTLNDTRILITVLAGDDENYEVLKSGDENSTFMIYCMHRKDNEEYNTAYITGFVDAKKTSWEIFEIQKEN
jgi:hypothetical protein